ncbi:MAG: insulinase family protein [Firmicutes bacterium]|nr:insulinase family protein [Bacillota bacterium]
MMQETLKFDKIGEVMHKYRHDSGLNAFVIPKKGYSKKYTVFATHYGSINNEFIDPYDNNTIKMPEGIAHFLEHKLFDQKEGSIMDKFSELGSSPNAYTSFNKTVYLFSCTERFDENLGLLLSFVQNPYFTELGVEKEKDIIKQEINMFRDNPGWRAFFNLLESLYVMNPVKNDIVGNHESIEKIDKEMLYKCYNIFYHPSNMVIFVIGDVDEERVFNRIESSISKKHKIGKIKRLFPEEPKEINREYIEEKMPVATPIFQMGFKDDTYNLKGEELLMREIAVKILLEIFMGRSSQLYNKLYEEGLINNTFEFDYTAEENYAYSTIGGESIEPGKVKEKIIDTVCFLLKDGLNKEDFQRVKKSLYGKLIRWFNSLEKVSEMFISGYFKGINIFDYFNIYDKINLEYLNHVMKGHFNLDRFAVSVIQGI